jgi:hypothetical protein
MMDSAPADSACARSIPAVSLLAGVVVAAAIVRSIVAWHHSIPRLFADEYIYTALSRSIGHGEYAIRGVTVHFPGLLEPLAAAPIWALFSTPIAYHLVQVENAIAVSLAAIPAYALSRFLGVSKPFSLGVALYTVLLPELTLVAYTSSDGVGYLVALVAIYAGVTAADSPTGRRQTLFLLAATLATLTRVEYFVLVPAYLAAAIFVDRREIWRKHRVALVALAPIVLVVAVAAVGYYGPGLADTKFNANYIRWFFLQMFLLALDAGVVIVPAAIALLLNPRSRRDRAFAAFVVVLALLLLGEATAHAADSSQFKERYLFVLLPLVAIAFARFAPRGRRTTVAAISSAAILVLAAARLPLSEYATSTFKTDSQFLFAVSSAQDRFGAGSTSLVIALLATFAAVIGVVVALRGSRLVVLAIPIIVAAVASTAAARVDIQTTNEVRHELPRDLTWVDHVAHGPITAIETPGSRDRDLLYELYWNTSIDRELLLGNASATDAFSAPSLRVARDGTLENVDGDFLFHDFGTTGRFVGARLVGRHGGFSLWRSDGKPRFRLDLEGRYRDGLLARNGTIRAWPVESDAGIRVSFQLAAPARRRFAVTLDLGRTSISLRPGGQKRIVCTRGSGPLTVPFAARTGTIITPDLRQVSARLTGLQVADVPRGRTAADGCRVSG